MARTPARRRSTCSPTTPTPMPGRSRSPRRRSPPTGPWWSPATAARLTYKPDAELLQRPGRRADRRLHLHAQRRRHRHRRGDRDLRGRRPGRVRRRPATVGEDSGATTSTCSATTPTPRRCDRDHGRRRSRPTARRRCAQGAPDDDQLHPGRRLLQRPRRRPDRRLHLHGQRRRHGDRRGHRDLRGRQPGRGRRRAARSARTPAPPRSTCWPTTPMRTQRRHRDHGGRRSRPTARRPWSRARRTRSPTPPTPTTATTPARPRRTTSPTRSTAATPRPSR